MGLHMDILRGCQCVFHDQYLKMLSIGGVNSRIIIGCKIWIAVILIGAKYYILFAPIIKFHAIGSGSVYLNSKINTSWFRRLTMV
jgi:hypothetical protein